MHYVRICSLRGARAYQAPCGSVHAGQAALPTYAGRSSKKTKRKITPVKIYWGWQSAMSNSKHCGPAPGARQACGTRSAASKPANAAETKRARSQQVQAKQYLSRAPPHRAYVYCRSAYLAHTGSNSTGAMLSLHLLLLAPHSKQICRGAHIRTSTRRVGAHRPQWR